MNEITPDTMLDSSRQKSRPTVERVAFVLAAAILKSVEMACETYREVKAWERVAIASARHTRDADE